jgi:uncharacterized membrane protein YraQ (UPF0718 family)
MTTLLLYALALAALGVSARRDPGRTRQALRGAFRSGVRLLPSLLILTAAVGLTMALVPPRVVARLFQAHGATGFLVLAGTGALLTIPAPIAYPLAAALHRMGAGLPALAAFITTLTMVGVVTAPVEIAAFGRRFTLLRQSLSLALALAVGLLMGVLL